MQLCKESVLGSVVVVAAMSLVTAASGEVITWTGLGDDDKWGTAENWSSDPFLPDADDDVYIPAFSTDGIQMDLGSPSEPEIIASLTVSVSAGGSLTIQADKGLQINGDFHVNVGSGACSWDLTMEEHSRLDLVDQDGNADLIHINVTMEPVTSGTPSELRVDGAIEQGDFEVNEGCIVTVGTGTAPERNELSGEWTISDGGEVTFENNTGTYEGEALHMTLAGGSTVTYRIAYYETGTFASAAEHELLYDEGDNILHVGDGEGYWALDLGYYTVVKRLATEASLRVSLLCKTAIRSYFGYEVVRDAWDTRNVDIWGEWIDSSVWWAGALRYEMISTDFEDSFTGEPVIFLDVPCLGAWRDLTLPDHERQAAVVTIMDEWNNADRTMDPGYGDGDEVGLFRDVYIGAQRGLRFYGAGDAKLYYYGTRTIDETGKVFLHDEEVEGDDIDELIIRAVGTIYGDWNGDCAITNVELAALQQAIAGGDETYNPLMDYDCDGQLTTQVELAAMLDNMTEQPPCGRGGGDGGGGGESWSESYEGYGDVPGLAAWLTEVLSEEQLKAFVADLAVAAAEFADSPVGQDLAELLSCLE